MQSYLIIHNDLRKAIDFVKEFCVNHGVSQIDQTSIQPKDSAESIGISEIREVTQTLLLKPFNGQKKAVIIPNAELLTVEAQNALLKSLEEPPKHTYILLLSNRQDALLTTITSRCTVRFIQREVHTMDDNKKLAYQEILATFHSWGIGKRLKEAETLAKDKQQAITWIEDITSVARDVMLEKLKRKELFIEERFVLAKLYETHKLLKTTNVNLRLALEQLFLYSPKT